MRKTTKLILMMVGFFSINASATDTKILRITGDTDFGQLAVGQSATKSITLHNDGNSSLSIIKIYLHPFISANYSFSNSCVGTDIPANGTCDVNITYSPIIAPPPAKNVYSGLIYVVSNKTSGGYSKYLKGTIDTKILRITGDTDFGQLDINDSSTKTITLHNDGNSPLHISKLYLHPYISTNYSFTHNCDGVDIPANGTCDVNITYSPIIAPSPAKNVYSGLIYVVSNKTSGSYSKYLKASINQNTNSAPIANAGDDQSVVLNGGCVAINLDGTQSSDPDSDTLSYNWELESKPEGSNASISNPTSSNPTLMADIQGIYTIKLFVNDGQLNSTPDTVDINVTTNNN